MTSASIVDVPASRQTSIGTVVFASTVGTIMEWYDFLIYATAATLVFNKLFFPTADPMVGTLAALGTFSVGFFARPLGGAIFGHFGDRLGRKSMLMITMFVMGFGTFCIGLLPTYETIGIWAPILLVSLRIVQGIGLGGEWGGAALMVLEHAPPGKRGFYGSFVQVGFPCGLVLATLTFSIVSQLPEADFLTWGWRIPFLLSGVLFALGAFVRSRVPETPVFLEMKKNDTLSKSPVAEAVFQNPKIFFTAIGLKISEVSLVYTLTVFLVVYATSKLALPRSVILNGVLYAALLELFTIPFFGWLSDKIGRRSLYIIGALFTVAFAFPLFWLIDTKDPLIIALTLIVAMNFGHGMMFGLQATYFPELFGARCRYSGASFGFQVAAAIGGGLSPLAATALLNYFGGTAGVSAMLIGFALITLLAAIVARETKDDVL